MPLAKPRFPMQDSSLTATTLSRRLRHCGTPPCGAVADLHVDLEYRTTISKLVFLTAIYSPEPPANLPRCLVVNRRSGSTSAQQIDDLSLELRRVVGPIAVDFPRAPAEGATGRRAPRMDRVICGSEFVIATD